MRDNGHKLKQDKFRLEIKRNLSPYGDSTGHKTYSFFGSKSKFILLYIWPKKKKSVP